MSYSNQFVFARKDLNLGVTTATANSGALKMPVGTTSVTTILDAGAGTGTSPTLDVAIQTSPDGGTTWYTVNRFAQVTTSAFKGLITWSPFRGPGEAGAAFTIADTGGAANINVTVTDDYRILATIGGSTPSFASIVVYNIFAGPVNPPSPF